MGTILAAPPMDDGFTACITNLCTALTGVAFMSTNVADFGGKCNSNALLRIVSTIGGTPTATVNLEGSFDNTNFYNIWYSLPASPDTWVNTALTITTAVTGLYVLRRVGGLPWRYVRLNVSADTNVTLTSDVASFA
jgi:hypothetical protein